MKFKVLLGAAVSVVVSGAAWAQDTIKMTYATYLPQTFSAVVVDDWFMDEVESRTGGKVEFERYYGGTLLPAQDIYPGVASGVADIGMGAAVYNRDLLPLSSGIVQPYVTQSVDAVAKAILDLNAENAAFEEEWTRNGLQLLYPLVSNENTVWTHKDIKSADDLKGMRIRALEGVAKSFEMLGATPVAMSPVDALQAFKSGAIDGLSSWAFNITTNFGLEDIAEYGGDLGKMGMYVSLYTAMNAASFDRLPDDVKAVFGEVIAEVPDKLLEITNKDADATVEKLSAAPDLKILRLSDEEAAAWKEKTAQPIWDEWTSEMEGLGFDGQALFDQYRELVAKYEADSTYVPGFDRITGK